MAYFDPQLQAPSFHRNANGMRGAPRMPLALRPNDVNDYLMMAVGMAIAARPNPVGFLLSFKRLSANFRLNIEEEKANHSWGGITVLTIHRIVWPAVAATIALFLAVTASDAQQAQAPKKQPQVEVVFCLDTTGSMGGLINAAKQKIWSISNQIVSGKPTPHVRVGLIAYRDRSDARKSYVTKIIDLTDDLDAIHSQLQTFRANGGGDFPESVNQALNEAVTKIKWSDNKQTLKIIFLVGDAPPKKYADDVTYQKTCKMAVRNNIIINTVQCGRHAQTQTAWKDICRLAEGKYVQIDARGGPIVTVKTPFDKELATINRKLATSTLVYGKGRFRREAKEKAKDAAALPVPGAASRAGFAGASGKTATYDLLDGIRAGRVELEKLKKEELPKVLQGKSLIEQRSYLKKVDKDRTILLRRAAELNTKRNAYIRVEQTKQSKTTRDSFDQNVLRVLQSQARRANIRYEAVGDKQSPKKK